MKRLKINVIALALGFVFSAGAMADGISKDDHKTAMGTIAAEYTSVKADPKAQMKTSDAHAAAIEESAEARSKAKSQAAARNDAEAARFDGAYEVAKKTCNTHPGAAKDHCLDEMKVGFGKD